LINRTVRRYATMKIGQITLHANLNANIPAALIATVVVGGLCYIVHEVLKNGDTSAAIINACFSNLPK